MCAFRQEHKQKEALVFTSGCQYQGTLGFDTSFSASKVFHMMLSVAQRASSGDALDLWKTRDVDIRIVCPCAVTHTRCLGSVNAAVARTH